MNKTEQKKSTFLIVSSSQVPAAGSREWWKPFRRSSSVLTISPPCRHWLVRLPRPPKPLSHTPHSGVAHVFHMRPTGWFSPQTRRTVSCRVSPALLRVRTPAVLRVGLRKNERRTGEAEAEAAAPEAGPSYRGGVRGRTRPDSSRRPTGHNLTLEKNVAKAKRKVISLAFPPPPFLFSDPPACSPSSQSPTSCLATSPHHYIQSNGTPDGLWFGL